MREGRSVRCTKIGKVCASSSVFTPLFRRTFRPVAALLAALAFEELSPGGSDVWRRCVCTGKETQVGRTELLRA